METKEKLWTKSELSKLQYDIIGAVIEVHRHMGPGLLESVYHRCLKYELNLRGMFFESELKTYLNYKDMEEKEEDTLRCDLLVERAIVLELKSVTTFAPIHESKLLNYMRLLKKPKGLLINFNCTNIVEEGYKSYVNDIYRRLPD